MGDPAEDGSTATEVTKTKTPRRKSASGVTRRRGSNKFREEKKDEIASASVADKSTDSKATEATTLEREKKSELALMSDSLANFDEMVFPEGMSSSKGGDDQSALSKEKKSKKTKSKSELDSKSDHGSSSSRRRGSRSGIDKSDHASSKKSGLDKSDHGAKKSKHGKLKRSSSNGKTKEDKGSNEEKTFDAFSSDCLDDLYNMLDAEVEAAEPPAAPENLVRQGSGRFREGAEERAGENFKRPNDGNDSSKKKDAFGHIDWSEPKPPARALRRKSLASNMKLSEREAEAAFEPPKLTKQGSARFGAAPAAFEAPQLERQGSGRFAYEAAMSIGKTDKAPRRGSNRFREEEAGEPVATPPSTADDDDFGFANFTEIEDPNPNSRANLRPARRRGSGRFRNGEAPVARQANNLQVADDPPATTTPVLSRQSSRRSFSRQGSRSRILDGSNHRSSLSRQGSRSGLLDDDLDNSVHSAPELILDEDEEAAARRREKREIRKALMRERTKRDREQKQGDDQEKQSSDDVSTVENAVSVASRLNAYKKFVDSTSNGSVETSTSRSTETASVDSSKGSKKGLPRVNSKSRITMEASTAIANDSSKTAVKQGLPRVSSTSRLQHSRNISMAPARK